MGSWGADDEWEALGVPIDRVNRSINIRAPTQADWRADGAIRVGDPAACLWEPSSVCSLPGRRSVVV